MFSLSYTCFLQSSIFTLAFREPGFRAAFLAGTEGEALAYLHIILNDSCYALPQVDCVGWMVSEWGEI